MIHDLFIFVLLNFKVFTDFLCLSVIDFLFKFLVTREHSLYNYNSFIFWDLFYGPEHSASWPMFQGCLKGMYILLFWGGMFYICQLDTFGWLFCLELLYPCWFCLVFLLVVETRVLNIPTTTVDLSVSPSSSISYCVMYFEVLLFGSYTSRIIISSWHSDLLIMMQCPFFLICNFPRFQLILARGIGKSMFIHCPWNRSLRTHF